MRFFSKYQLILFLSFVGGLLFAVKSFYKVPKEVVVVVATPTTIPLATPQVSPSPTATNYEMIADKLMPLWRYLPYQGKDFIVENYLEEGVLIVSLHGATKAEAATAIKAWMDSHKVDSTTHTIEWR